MIPTCTVTERNRISLLIAEACETPTVAILRSKEFIINHLLSKTFGLTSGFYCGHHGDIFAFYSLYTVLIMASSFHGPPARLHNFVITCKRCKENIAAPVQTMPDTWIMAKCPLCHEKRRYLPAEIFRGRLSFDFEAWSRKAGRV